MKFELHERMLEALANWKGFESINENQYLCSLFDLMLYRYPELTGRVFNLLVSYFTRKRTLIELVSKIQILENYESNKALTKINKLR